MASKAIIVKDLASRRRSELVSIQKEAGDRNDTLTIRYGNIRADLLGKMNEGRDKLMKRRKDRLALLARLRKDYANRTSKVLSDKALAFLVKMSDIDAPTFTSIFAGYELARASAAEREKELIDSQSKLITAYDSIDAGKTAEELKQIEGEIKQNETERKDQLKSSNELATLEQEVSQREFEDLDKSVLQEQKAEDQVSLAREKQRLKDEAVVAEQEKSALAVISQLEDAGKEEDAVSSEQQAATEEPAIPEDTVYSEPQTISEEQAPPENDISSIIYDATFSNQASLPQDVPELLQPDVVDYISAFGPSGDTENAVAPSALNVENYLIESGLDEEEIKSLDPSTLGEILLEKYKKPEDEEEDTQVDLKQKTIY